MIELKKLNDQKYEDIVEEAKKYVSIFSDDWNNTQEYDPGVTLIELFAWLKLSQNEYINQISSLSYILFLSLIGIKRKSNVGSRTLIDLKNVSQNLIIPKGTRWLSESFIFENLETSALTQAKIKKIVFNNSGQDFEVDYELVDGKRVFNVFGDLEEECRGDNYPKFTIQFDQEIKSDIKYSMYFDILNRADVERNPIVDKDSFIPMSEIKWEFYGEKNGVVGWHDANIIDDSTFGLLFSGLVYFKIDGKMVEKEGVFQIRAILEKEDYDFPPAIKDLKLNVIELEQKATLCETVEVKKSDIYDGILKIYLNIALYGRNECYIKKDGTWVQTDQIRYEKNVDEGSTSFFLENFNNYLDKYNDEDIVFRIVCYDSEFMESTSIGSGTRISSQRVDIKYKDIKYDEFEIMIGHNVKGEYRFEDWEKVESFIASGKYDKQYMLNTDSGVIAFGNHKNGMIPYKGRDNIKIRNLSCTKGVDSNIRSHMINRVVSSNTNIQNLKINQFIPSVGGFYYESVDDMKRRALKLFEEGEKAVTAEDYERIVRKTPGLIIDNVKILPCYYPSETEDVTKCVTIVVRGDRRDKTKPLVSYCKNILKQVDKYRLINTKVAIVTPTYVGLSISGTIILNSYSDEDKKLVYEAVEKFVQKLNRSWGSNLYMGDLFGELSRLKIVSRIKNIHVVPTGDYLERKASEDIIAKPNGSYYIKNIDFDFYN